MRISHVKIKGFRSLQKIEIKPEDYTTLIGKNDCGKSSFLKALEFLFDPEAHIGSTDVCGFDDHDGETSVQATISDCWHPNAHNNELKVRRVFGDMGANTLYFEGPVPTLAILRNMAEGLLKRHLLDSDDTLEPETKTYAQKAIREICPKGPVPPDSWVQLFESIVANRNVEFETGWHLFDDDELQKIVQVVFLRADVRGEEEVSVGGSSIFTKIGQFILGNQDEAFPEITAAKEKLAEAIERICTKTDDNKWRIDKLNLFEVALAEEIERFDSNVAASTHLSPPRIPSFDFSLGLLVSDEWAGSVDGMGHGMRRSLVFAMLRAHRRIVEPVANAEVAQGNRPLYLFLMEEPEIYLHPQAERRRMAQLKALASDANAQVILCTHSAIFVDLEDYKGIQRLERPNRRNTSVRGWMGPDLIANDKKTLSLIHRFDPGRAAMLFADLVILVEGQCESDAIPFLADDLGLTDVDTDVEVVDCTGNQNIPVFQRVLESFGIKYVAWPDSDDVVPVGLIQGIRTAAYGKIVVTNHNWEVMNGLPAGGNLKIYNSWKHFVFDGNPANADLEIRIRAAYGWNDYP